MIKNKHVRKVAKVVIAPIRITGDYLFGEDHKPHHRMIIGTVVMVLGVCIAKTDTHITALHYLCDTIGYAVHGIGFSPYLEAGVKIFKGRM